METARGEHIVETVSSIGSLWTRPHLLDETVVDEVIVRDGYRLHGVNLRGATVLDLGAHVGVFSSLCASRHASRVFAVEPEPGNLEVLRMNVERWPQVQIIPKAMGGAIGTTNIVGESGGARTGPWDDGTPVEMVTLTRLMDDLGLDYVDLLKLDMEGAEAETLLACDRLERVARIVMETHGPAICPWVPRPRVGEIIEHLLPTHTVEACGHPFHLGYLFAQRNR